jgi:hypothetical protein
MLGRRMLVRRCKVYQDALRGKAGNDAADVQIAFIQTWRPIHQLLEGSNGRPKRIVFRGIFSDLAV